MTMKTIVPEANVSRESVRADASGNYTAVRDLAFEEAEKTGDQSHVLVVEDDPVILELLQDAISNTGCKVLIAKNAADGLALYQHYVDSTYCVILDYGIPGMHASRLLDRFMEIDPEVKVILSSGYPQNFIGEDFPLDKIAGFMAKPYDPQVLLSELARIRAERDK